MSWQEYGIRPREGSCDALVFDEVWVEDVYRLRKLQLKWGLVRGRPALDLGANVGAFTLMALALGATKVHAVEPQRENVEQLRTNLRVAGVADRVVIHEAAVVGDGTSPRQLRMIAGDARFPSISFQAAPEGEGEVVPTITVDELLLQEPEWGVLKLDIEGGEYDVIRGASLDALQRVAAIVAEFHGPGMGQHCSWIEAGRLGALTEKLTEWGHVETMGAATRGGQLYARRY